MVSHPQNMDAEDVDDLEDAVRNAISTAFERWRRSHGLASYHESSLLGDIPGGDEAMQIIRKHCAASAKGYAREEDLLGDPAVLDQVAFRKTLSRIRRAHLVYAKGGPGTYALLTF